MRSSTETPLCPDHTTESKPNDEGVHRALLVLPPSGRQCVVKVFFQFVKEQGKRWLVTVRIAVEFDTDPLFQRLDGHPDAPVGEEEGAAGANDRWPIQLIEFSEQERTNACGPASIVPPSRPSFVFHSPEP